MARSTKLHHIISDTWPVGVFIQELGTLYATFSGGKPSPFAALPIQYAGHRRCDISGFSA